jgi:hypothetical protein
MGICIEEIFSFPYRHKADKVCIVRDEEASGKSTNETERALEDNQVSAYSVDKPLYL